VQKTGKNSEVRLDRQFDLFAPELWGVFRDCNISGIYEIARQTPQNT
jgi:hypothetical protein